ncbi:MAG TPA: MBL fold metallo-hydrolase [Symbiobacteriaceae bacterium]|nr:MBL fold metallo-hydrolase [Symbiobacteriaceae bacterium]
MTTTTPRITFHGGIGTIGGTKIIVQEGDYRVLFDFGATYAPGGDFWGGRLQSRHGSARLRDMVTLGYTPALDGVYQPAYAATAGLKPGEGDTTQVFISHLHLDHMALVDLIADEVPVWMHEDSLRLFQAVATTGEKPPVPVGARAFTWGQPIQVGPIKVTPVAVDHDVPGASALLIETSAGTVVYSGDLRTHGPHPALVEEFVKAARATNPKVLLIEGTRMGEVGAEPNPDRAPSLKENEVPGRVLEHLQECTGLALITLYPRNPLRIANIAEALPQVGRTMVLSPEMAHVYQTMGYSLEHVAVYLRAKDKQAMQHGKCESWLRTLLASGVTTVDAAAVRSEQTKYLLQLFYWDMAELVDLQPVPGSIFVHSNGEPLGRFDPAFELFVHWLDHFGIALKWAPSTGHATPDALFEIIRGINPAVLMPIHSFYPERMEVEGIRRVLPELGATYDIATGEKIKG